MGPAQTSLEPALAPPSDAASVPPAMRSAKATSKGAVRFRAELDIAELDDRRRPGPSWTARGIELSRSHLTFRSKRMCYPNRLLLIAVHLVDDRPVPLFGQVRLCEYDSDGLYRTDITLHEVPDEEPVGRWLKGRGANGSF